MKFRKTLIHILLAISLVFALSAWAQEKPFTEQQVLDMIRAGLGNDSGAKLIVQRGIDFTPDKDFLKHAKSAGAKEVFLKALRTNKPISREEVDHMVRAGLGEESGAQMITQRGIDFAPTENYIQSLKSAGAKEVFIKAVRERMPLGQVQILAQLAAELPCQRVTMLVKDRGIDFPAKDDYLQQVRLAGGDDGLVAAIKSAKVMAPATVDPAAQARQDDIRQHVAHGAELKLKGQFAEAEQEFRAGLTLSPSSADIYLDLASVLGRQKKWDDEATATREVLRLNPNNEMAHILLGAALAGRGDWDSAVAENREALRLNPNDDFAHASLGIALGGKHDWDGEINEEREALRLNPDSDFARANLGAALANKHDWDGAIAEYRKALDLNPNNDVAHANLAAALANKGDADASIAEYRKALSLNPGNEVARTNLAAALATKGDWDGAVAQYRELLRMNPNDDRAHVNLGDALRNNGNWDGAVAEYHDALKSNPNNDLAHAGLGLVLAARGNLDGTIAEEREALRLNPNNAAVHASLGDALEQKGDRAAALTEYRAAATLDPKNINYKQNCERLMH
ncbi:MAG: tetratricopeptide repeat protein [Acidobacteriota bacterium]|nr:tetratricopeptide repeat protein [Acidobacteriota bacterium]